MTARLSDWVLGARSETGYVRTANEDRMGWTRTGYGDVYVCCDGMGGYRGGALAAELTIATLQEQLAKLQPESDRCSDQVRQAFAVANREVFSRRDPEDPETREMGATAVALIVCGTRYIVGHVGDSRAYLWRKKTGLHRLTTDHTRVQTMLDAGLLTAEQAASHPDASVLDRAMGHQPTVQADVSDWRLLKPDDLLMLCSDGLCGYVEDQEIADILNAEPDPQKATDRLIEAALAKGGHDNVTVQLVRYAPKGRPLDRLPVRYALGAVLVLVAAAAGALASGFVVERRLATQLAEKNEQVRVLTAAQGAGGKGAHAAAQAPAPGSASAAASTPAAASAPVVASAPVTDRPPSIAPAAASVAKAASAPSSPTAADRTKTSPSPVSAASTKVTPAEKSAAQAKAKREADRPRKAKPPTAAASAGTAERGSASPAGPVKASDPAAAATAPDPAKILEGKSDVSPPAVESKTVKASPPATASPPPAASVAPAQAKPTASEPPKAGTTVHEPKTDMNSPGD